MHVLGIKQEIHPALAEPMRQKLPAIDCQSVNKEF
jgi:hypothetical protein